MSIVYGVRKGWKYDHTVEISNDRRESLNKYVSLIQSFLKKAMFKIKLSRIRKQKESAIKIQKWYRTKNSKMIKTNIENERLAVLIDDAELEDLEALVDLENLKEEYGYDKINTFELQSFQIIEDWIRI